MQTFNTAILHKLPMRTEDTAVNAIERFAIGIEHGSGRYYLPGSGHTSKLAAEARHQTSATTIDPARAKSIYSGAS